ncbi:hypothetical protein JG688_00017221 [Phytophthora aleatoria]|uniref:ZSWIM1/3 RNaseH-like domain-containing protein n=1 Tax=Phytophthora aleatoria TaxID=2496075 RepID=A0A8J5LVH8_9STRA|nr:hypothetical protein JG688_00017221 [Phytophthora aleatoria]
MANDTFGKGQFVMHAVLQKERISTLLTALEEFKRNNPAWSRIECILIDKDFTEISVLKMAFLGTLVLLSQLYVLKYLREETASSDYGINVWEKQQLYGIVNLIVYAKTEREFERYRKYMRHVMAVGRGDLSGLTAASYLATDSDQLGAIGSEAGALDFEVGEVGAGGVAEAPTDLPIHPIEAYFAKNWDSCQHMWCSFEHQSAVTLGNNTNNRIEASWKQLKELVNSFMGVDEFVVSIMCYQSQSEKEVLDSVYNLSRVHNPKYDREMQFLSNLVSEHACELVYEQYAFATDRAKYKYCEPIPDVIFIQRASEEEDLLDEPLAEYSVTKRDWSCSCLFMSSRLFPFRHVSYLRKALNYENIIPTQLLNPLWLLSPLRTDSGLEQDVLTRRPFAISQPNGT